MNNRLKATLATIGFLIATFCFGALCMNFPKIIFYTVGTVGVSVIVWMLYSTFFEMFENRWRRLDQQGSPERISGRLSDDL